MFPIPERWLALTAGCIALLCFLLVGKAFGHDHERPELNGWFKQLKSGKGLCCDGDEALHLGQIDWETQDKPGNHHRVRIPVNGQAYEKARHGEQVETMWIDVPDEALINEPNKAGEALVWPLYGYMGASVRCFAPGALI